MARAVGRRAEAERERLAALWFGQQTPNWRERCVIHVKTAKKAGGATVFQYDEKRLYAPKQEIRVEGTMSDILKDVLPQQITHTLLAHDLGVAYARWAETGAGILSQTEAARRSHAKAVRAARAGGQLLRLERLFELKDYPRDADVMIAQSASVAEFLVERKGCASFLTFVERRMQRGWDEAVQRYYGFANVAGRDNAWLTSLNG